MWLSETLETVLYYVKKKYSLYDMHFILVKLYNIEKKKAITGFDLKRFSKLEKVLSVLNLLECLTFMI